VSRKKTKGPRTRSTERPEERRRVPKLLFAILLVAAALRLWRIDSAVGGFHDHNEANYTLMAKNFLHSSPLFPNPDGHLFLETPPFYPYVLALIFGVTGVSIVAARLFTVAASLGLIVATFLFGRRLYGEHSGLAAALLVAVTPLAVLTGRNVQTDTLFVFLMITALLVYPRAEDGSRSDWLRFGVLLGLAIFTKLFAVIAVAALLAWELLANRDRRTLAKKGIWQAFAVAAAVPLAFYGYHALRAFPYLRQQMTGGAASSTTFPASAAQWGALSMEALWAVSPAVALLITAGVVAALFVRSREALFALFPFLAFGAFYLFVHKHSYYLLTLLPFGAVLAGRWVCGLSARGARIAALAAASLTGAFFSLVDLTGMKLGFSEFADLQRIAAGLPGTTHPLLISREILDSHGTVLLLSDPKARLVTLENLQAGPDGRLHLPEGDTPYLLSFVPPQTQSVSDGWLLWRERFGLELFGWTVAEAHANPHFFRQGAYTWQRTGGALDFGLRSLRSYPAMALVPVPPGVGLYESEQGLRLRRADASSR
jgi:hypothetical protein